MALQSSEFRSVIRRELPEKNKSRRVISHRIGKGVFLEAWTRIISAGGWGICTAWSASWGVGEITGPVGFLAPLHICTGGATIQMHGDDGTSSLTSPVSAAQYVLGVEGVLYVSRALLSVFCPVLLPYSTWWRIPRWSKIVGYMILCHYCTVSSLRIYFHFPKMSVSYCCGTPIYFPQFYFRRNQSIVTTKLSPSIQHGPTRIARPVLILRKEWYSTIHLGYCTIRSSCHKVIDPLH